MAFLPEADRHVLNVLRELRAGLYQSDYSERLGEPSQPHRDKCAINASLIKDRNEKEPGTPMPLDGLYRTVDEALTRLREDS